MKPKTPQNTNFTPQLTILILKKEIKYKKNKIGDSLSPWSADLFNPACFSNPVQLVRIYLKRAERLFLVVTSDRHNTKLHKMWWMRQLTEPAVAVKPADAPSRRIPYRGRSC